MSRTVKKHDERLEEFLQAGKQLFFSKGYRNTSVKDILDSVGVAKGTFYHYFDSKEALLDRMVQEFTQHSARSGKEIIERTDISACEKMRLFFSELRGLKIENIELIITLGQCLISSSNLEFKYKYYQSNMEVFKPMLAQVIDQGMGEKSFNPVNSQAVAEYILLMGMHYGEIIYRLIDEKCAEPDCAAHVEYRLHLWFQTIESLLGVSSGTIDIVDSNIISQYIRRYCEDVKKIVSGRKK